MNFRFEDLDVDEILKERSERYYIENSIFEDCSADVDVNVDFYTAEVCPPENVEGGAVTKLVPYTPRIDFDRIGTNVSDLSLMGKMFDDAQMHKNLCESKPDNMINNPVFHVSCADLHRVIQNGLLMQNMKNVVLHECLNKYMFFLISWHSSETLASAASGTLMFHFCNSSAEDKGPKWIPSLENISLVFCNHGVSRELLASWDIALPKKDSSTVVQRADLPPVLRLRNIMLVLRVLSSLICLHKSACYSMEELDRLLCMVLILSLDKYTVKSRAERLNQEFSNCVKSILYAYPSSEWQKKGKVSSLSQALFHKLRNVFIGDIYFISHNYIFCPGFGQRLAHSLMHAFIQSTVWSSDPVTHLDVVEVKHIRRILKADSLLEMNYRTQYYVVLMVENIITYLIYTSNDSLELSKIKQAMSNLKIKSTHSEDMVDYLLVKQVATRAVTTWKLSAAELT